MANNQIEWLNEIPQNFGQYKKHKLFGFWFKPVPHGYQFSECIEIQGDDQGQRHHPHDHGIEKYGFVVPSGKIFLRHIKQCSEIKIIDRFRVRKNWINLLNQSAFMLQNPGLFFIIKYQRAHLVINIILLQLIKFLIFYFPYEI